MSVRPILAQAIRHKRIKKGMSTRALSQTAGLSTSYVSKLESGEIEPSVKAFGKLAIVLEMNYQEVYYCIVHEGLNEAIKSRSEGSE